MLPDRTELPTGGVTQPPQTWSVAHRVVQQLFMARMPVPTLDDDRGTAYAALERLVTSSLQVLTYLDNLNDDLPEGADAVRAFRDSHHKWFGLELTQFLECCAELGYDTAPPDDDDDDD